jgi:hypothetical protein
MPETLTRREAVTLRARLGGPWVHDDLSAWICGVLTDICMGSRVPAAIKHPLRFICVQLYWGPG